MRDPVNFGIGKRPRAVKSSFMARDGINTRTLSQLLDTNFATKIKNWLIDAEGQLVKRKGLRNKLEIASIAGYTMFEHWYDDVFIVGYGTTISAVDLSAGTETVIKNDYDTSAPISGQRYGDYFFVGTGGNYTEKVVRIVKALTYEEITAAPKARIVYAFIAPAGSSAGARLFTGNIGGATDKMIASDVDDGTNPPFDDWTDDANANTGFTVFNRSAGTLNTITSNGGQIILGYEGGKTAFRITVIDVSGTATKDIVIDYQNLEQGMEKGAITTSKGVFFANQRGLFNLLTVGSTNIPFSEQTAEISIKLKDTAFDFVTYNNLSIVYDIKRHLILYTFADDSTVNNTVLAYNIDTKSVVRLPMAISSFTKKGDTIYGASSINGKIYEVFADDTDDLIDINTEYEQELQILDLDSLFDLEKFTIQAQLSEDVVYTIHFDIWDRTGTFVEDYFQYTITGGVPSKKQKGLGSAGFPAPVLSEGIDSANKVQIYENEVFIPEVWRLIIRITGEDGSPATINFFNATITDRQEKINLNNLTQI